MKTEVAYLRRILRCCQRIREDSAPGRDAVFQSHTLQDAIHRNLQVLCESTQRLAPATRGRRPVIPWPAVAGLRGARVHDYFDIDFELIRLNVIRDRPDLETAIRELLDSGG